jgi:hypothetical protein
MVLLLVAVAVPASAATVHDEAVNGDLSTSEAAPTPLAFSVGGNTVIGTTGNVAGVDRDFITFTLAPGHVLVGLNLLAFAPDNVAFAAFNTGTTSFVPGPLTAASFLAGIHPDASMIGTNLMTEFVCCSVTGNSLPLPELGPGDYCFVIQQTSPITTSYSLDFVVSGPVPTTPSTWGGIKALYP